MTDQEPDLVHVNFGIHDAVRLPDGEHQILLPQYCLSLRRFIAKVRALEKTQMIWATTTPMYTPDSEKPMAQWPINKQIGLAEYNAAALEIVRSEGVPVNDLHDVIVRSDFTKCLTEDGCHMTDFGNDVLSDAVVEVIASHSGG